MTLPHGSSHRLRKQAKRSVRTQAARRSHTLTLPQTTRVQVTPTRRAPACVAAWRAPAHMSKGPRTACCCRLADRRRSVCWDRTMLARRQGLHVQSPKVYQLYWVCAHIARVIINRLAPFVFALAARPEICVRPCSTSLCANWQRRAALLHVQPTATRGTLTAARSHGRPPTASAPGPRRAAPCASSAPMRARSTRRHTRLPSLCLGLHWSAHALSGPGVHVAALCTLRPSVCCVPAALHLIAHGHLRNQGFSRHHYSSYVFGCNDNGPAGTVI